jgi:large-conductance mechanosensitive channel
MSFLLRPVDKVVELGEYTFKDFGNFLTQQDIVTLAVATALGVYLNNFINDIMNIIGVPIINKILSKEKNTEEEYNCDIFGVEINFGKVLEVVLKLIITLIIIYLLLSKIPSLILPSKKK